MLIRPADDADLEAMLAIYRPIVETTAISFEEKTPSVESFADRLASLQPDFGWLVAEDGRNVVGYAYAAPHRERSAYRFSVETTIYVASGSRARGIGTRLYGELMSILGSKGYESAFAGISLPNPGSVAFHEAMGFSHIGVGYKFGVWHDVGWW